MSLLTMVKAAESLGDMIHLIQGCRGEGSLRELLDAYASNNESDFENTRDNFIYAIDRCDAMDKEAIQWVKAWYAEMEAGV